jgi:excisionase family DNA binding protein
MAGVGEDRDTAQDRVTIQEAARRLGVKEDAIRKRIQRGTLPHEKTDEGQVFVWVDTAQDTTEDAYRDVSRDALLEAKDETISALQEQLAQANERDRENRRIIAALTSRIPAIEAPQESRDPPSGATPQPGRVEPQPAVEGTRGEDSSPLEAQESHEMHMPEVHSGPLPRDRRSQTPSERPWWRRLFEG